MAWGRGWVALPSGQNKKEDPAETDRFGYALGFSERCERSGGLLESGNSRQRTHRASTTPVRGVVRPWGQVQKPAVVGLWWTGKTMQQLCGRQINTMAERLVYRGGRPPDQGL